MTSPRGVGREHLCRGGDISRADRTSRRTAGLLCSPAQRHQEPAIPTSPARPLTRVRPLTGLLAAALAAGVLTTTLTGTSSADRPATGLSVDLETASTKTLQAALTAGKLSSKELVAAYLERIGALNSDGPGLNAVRAVNPQVYAEAVKADTERKQGKLRGPLHGIPVLVKDNIDVAGMPTTAGVYALKDSVPAGDAPVVTQLRAAGAVILGKTNLSEFANFLTGGMPSGYSSLGGQVLNPYDTSVTPSGSSSGSGAAMAAALGAATVGTETSGSILSPAAATSLVAVKPTVGLISRTGIIPISATQDTAGPMVRSVHDAAAMLSAMDGDDAEDSATTGGPSTSVDYTAGLSETALQGKRIGVIGVTNDPNYTAAQAVLREQGAVLVPVAAPGSTGASILTYEFKRDLNAYLARLPEGAPMRTLADVIAFNTADPTRTTKFGMTQLLASQAVDLSPGSADTAAYTAALTAGLTSSRASIDALLTRGTPDPADDLSAIVSPQSTTGTGARAGYPTVMVPNGYAAATRRPTALSFLGTAYSEGTLLALAYDFEQAAKPYEAWKPVSAVNPTLYRCVDRKDAPADCAP